MSTVINRAAAQAFSPALYRPILSGKPSSKVDLVLGQLREALCSGEPSNAEVLDAAFAHISRQYKSEYFYRNLITSKIFVGRHRATNSAILNEVVISGSIADCVLINGQGVVYEIKTEFDSPEKLHGQLADYYKAFGYVNVVVNESQAKKYLAELANTPAGLLAVTSRNTLSQLRSPVFNSSQFQTRTMFNLLRASELEQVLLHFYDTLPSVPNGLRYREYLSLARKIPEEDFQDQVQKILKLRSYPHSRRLLLDRRLCALRGLMAQLQMSNRQAENLMDWLELKET